LYSKDCYTIVTGRNFS